MHFCGFIRYNDDRNAWRLSCADAISIGGRDSLHLPAALLIISTKEIG
jgi:hypothetical protein